jgi:hypothetical protein
VAPVLLFSSACTPLAVLGARGVAEQRERAIARVVGTSAIVVEGIGAGGGVSTAARVAEERCKPVAVL